MKTAVEWLEDQYIKYSGNLLEMGKSFEQAKQMEKEQMLDFGEFIIDELAPMAQNREWVEERYNYFKSE